METARKIELLDKWGYFYGTGVKPGELKQLSKDHPLVKNAVRKYQDYLAPEFAEFSTEVRGKVEVSDDIDDPAFDKLMEMPRCGMPDIGPDAGDTSEVSMPVGNSDTGSGSWRAGCHPEFPGRHSATFRVNPSRYPASKWGRIGDPNSIFEQAMKLFIAAYADVGLAIIRRDTPGRVNMEMQWTNLRGPIGLAQVPRSFSCNSSHWNRYEINFRPSSPIFRLAFLFAHEVGHNCGWGHTRGGIMNASLISGTFHSNQWRRDTNLARCIRNFGGRAINMGPGPGPDPDPGPDGVDWSKVKFI